MLAKKLIPGKFVLLMVEVVLASLLLTTSDAYPSLNGTSATTFMVGCAIIIVFCVIQLVFTFIGISVFNLRIHFENFVFNLVGALLLGWFCFAKWPREYIWYIWGFLCVYPFLNELLSMVSVICHNHSLAYEKYQAER